MAKTIAEQIADLEATREAKAARMNEVVQKSLDENRSTDTAEAEEFDTLESEVKSLDADLTRLRKLERMQASKATPASGKEGEERKANDGSGEGIRVQAVKSALPKGTRFARYAMALAAGRGSITDSVRYAKQWESSTPEVAAYIEKAVAGTTTNPTWAAELVDETNLVGEFVDLLRPETLLGKMSGFRNVPFNVKIPVQTSGSTIGWVGEGAVKPVGELAFDTITLGHNKVAGIVVITEELARFSSPDAEATVRRDLIEQSAQFLDDAFINPAHAAVAGVSPASVTNGVTPVPASGTDADALRCDLQTLVEEFLSANLSPSGSFLVMTSVMAARISLFQNALGQSEFPGIGANGGTLAGFTVVTSENVPQDVIVLVKPSEILLADDGSVQLDASREATLDMNGGAAPVFSLWQRNCVGIRAERFITWAKRRPQAVAYISGAAYSNCVGSV